MELVFLNSNNVNQKNPHDHVCVLGFFDGVHLGHQALINKGKQAALQKMIPLRVMTFSPHPSVVVNSDKAITTLLTPLREKAKCMEMLGVDELAVVSFTKETAAMDPELFVKTYLRQLGCVHAVIGFDFAYGKRGAGKANLLKKHGQGFFDVSIISEQTHKRQKIGSTEIRRKLDQGDVESIPGMLGRSFMSEVSVLDVFDKRTTGFVPGEYHMPCPGVYEVVLQTGRTAIDATCYVTGETENGEQTVELLFNRKVSLQKGCFRLEWLARCDVAEAEEVVWNHERIYAY
ncbi:FAD synthetase family protein [Bacillus sp. JCM 19041]|uniref:FAD synthetase family protein n=1 Tax=Bacillus sp. JCM 19041 TaxID=1460637 RepID=UPI0006D148EC